PPKSIICMPCHTATFSIGDIPSAAAVIIFLMGTLSIVFIWFSAGKSRKTDNGASSTGLIHVAEVLILDVLLQRRLFRVSIKRWAIHEMIFLPLLFRFLWGITALVLSLFYPEQDITWIMLDKNNPVTGLFFDITGIIILLGGILMFIEKKMNKILNSITGLPKSDVLVTLLLACIILTGFIVEGARIAMTGFPEGSQYSFTGSLIGRTLTGYHLNGFFAYLWYLHAVVTAVFIAYFPFSRMFHIITAPLGLLLRGSSED
ncbi:MAG: respiratory nitrate reductase subunit gamma, partial [Deltaproteobacteria bacterium]|nr:respiratory nitrate reductase subunit gamma [Deltaproteobacteria bacterium]